MTELVDILKDEFIRPSELAKRLHINPHSIYRCIQNGSLPAFKACGSIIIKVKDAEDWIKEYFE